MKQQRAPMKLAELRRGGRSPQLPLRIELADAAGPATLVLQQLLRVLPGQRYVGVAEWRGRKVLAKLLVGGKAARARSRSASRARTWSSRATRSWRSRPSRAASC